nr:LCP family protein [Streptomyces sp. HNM0574]
MALMVLAGGLAYWKLGAGLRTVDVNGLLGDRPSHRDGDGSVNILLMGSDTRGDGNGAYAGGADDGARSDTTVLLHVAAGRKRATAVSIPRDTVVDRPRCRTAEGRTVPGSAHEPFNYAFAYGGPACTVATVEHVTGLPVDHFAVLEFRGMAALTDAVGGVEVDVPDGIAPGYGVDLEPGKRRLDGRQAVAFLRLRHVGKDQSDLRRIERQQEFFSGFARAARSSAVLTRPDRLTELMDATGRAVVTDEELGSPSALVALAWKLRGLDPDRIRYLTPELEPDPDNPRAWVRFADSASGLWRSLR